MGAPGAARVTGRGVGITPRLGVLLIAVAATLLPAVVPAHAGALMGTWRGTLTMDGQPIEFTATFSENDYFLFTYENALGMVRTVELSAPGQLRFMPPGGGVMTMVVESVVKRPNAVAYVLRTSFERTGNNGSIEQQYVTEEADYAVTAEGLRVRIVRRPASYFSDKGGAPGGARNARVVEGLLQKKQ